MAGKKGRSFADVASYVRRSAKQRIERLEARMKVSKNALVKKAAEKRIEQIRDTISRTYLRDSNGKRLKEPTPEISRAVSELAQYVRGTSYLSKRGQRSLAATENQLNAATVKDKASIYTAEDVKIFYRATQRLWQDVPVAQRNEVILQKTGYEKLSDLVADVLAANEVARQKARDYREKMTREQREKMDREYDEKEAAQYPNYLKDVIQLSENSFLVEIKANPSPEE